MKAQCIVAVYLVVLGSAGALQSRDQGSPIEKVIKLLEDLKKDVEDDAKDEAKTYDKFSCFCKDNTDEKSEAITDGQITIDDESATIGEKTADVAMKEKEVEDLKKQIEDLRTAIQNAEQQRATEKAEYEAVTADLTKAITSIEGAIAALEKAKPSLATIKRTVRRAVAMADVLQLKPKHSRELKAFLQDSNKEEPEERGEYESQTGGIIDILKELEEDFNKNKDEKDEEEEKASKAHSELMEEKQQMLEDAETAKEEAEEKIEKLKEEIAEAKEKVVEAEAKLKDDQLYLKDLTERCEVKAKEWDQRSQMRADEITAITKALEVIEGGAKDVELKEKELLQTQDGDSSSVVSEASESKTISDHRALDIMDDDVGDLGLAFVQERGSLRTQVSKFLKKTEYVSATSLEMHRKQALTFLALEGRRLGSGLLMSTAIKLDGNPFKKVKALIQGLIEKLLQEMADEAGHKGFCDTELSKAKNNRDFERERSKKQSADLEKLEVTKEELKESIEKYKEELEELNAALEKASKLRDEEKEDNEATIKEQTEGLNAIKEAIKILKDFYSGASRAKVFFQGVDEDAPDAPPGGAYKGQQKSANKIIGMLQTIQSNFEEAIKEAEEAEAESHRTFVEFDRESKGSISSKETGLSQSESDLKATEIAIKEGHSELEQTMKLLDDALKTLEELKPACLDPGMSYDDRKEAKEREIAALKKALCLLDPEGKEEDC